jgi:hypothetical protein
MFKNLIRHLMAITAILGIALPASATTYGVDYTDLWGTQGATESGWGLNLIQQGDIIFATMFVYGADNSARWYSASELAPVGGSTSSFNGQLFETRGPYFGAGSFDPNTVTRNVVGSMSINFIGTNAGTLTYTVNGVQVVKQIARFTWRGNNLQGNYLGGLTAKCTNGTAILIFDTLTVTQSSSQAGATVGMQVRFYNTAGVLSQCNFNGTYGATGRLNSVNGSFACSGGTVNNTGNFSVTGIEAGVNGFHGNFTGTDQYCTMNGTFGGVRDIQ